MLTEEQNGNFAKPVLAAGLSHNTNKNGRNRISA